MVFDHVGSLKKYDSVLDMLRDFFELRMKYYHLRKDWLTGMLQAESSKLSNQARFILEKIQGTLVIGKQLFSFSSSHRRTMLLLRIIIIIASIIVQFLFLFTLFCLFLITKPKKIVHVCREQAEEGADRNAAADGL